MKEIIEQKLQEKLNDGSIDKIVSNSIEQMFKEALDELLRWNSPIKKALEEKLKPILSESVEKSDVSKYAIKTTEIINEALERSPLSNHKKVLENLAEFFGENFKFNQKVKLTEIFEKYADFIENHAFDASDFDTDDFDTDEGDRRTDVECYMTVEEKYKGYFSRKDNWIVKFSNSVSEKSERLAEKTNFEFEIYNSYDDKKHISFGSNCLISDFQYMPKFALYLMQLKNNYVEIDLDSHEESYDVTVTFDY